MKITVEGVKQMERSNVILNGVLAVAEMISKIEELDKRVKELEKSSNRKKEDTTCSKN